MHKREKKFNFDDFGMAIKHARKAKGWTQEHLASLVDCTARNIMHIENEGQHPSLDTLYLLVTHLDLSADQFLRPEKTISDMRSRVNILLDSLDDTELVVIEATANGLKTMRKAGD